MCAPGSLSAADFDAAQAFGAREAVSDVALSPDGTKLAFIAPSAGQGSTLFVVDTTSDAPPKKVISASGNPERLSGCNWASNVRLVCTFWGVQNEFNFRYNFSRLLAIGPDGSNPKIVSLRDSSKAVGLATGGGQVIDWLPDGNGSVLMSRYYIPQDSIGTLIRKDAEGLGVDRVDTVSGRSTKVEPPKLNSSEYITDGLGIVRIMGTTETQGSTGQMSAVTNYSYRKKGEKSWNGLSDYDSARYIGFNPHHIDAARDVVYGLMKKNGRFAAYEMSLDGSNRTTLVYERPDVDIDGFEMIGRRERVVGVRYTTDISQVHYIDPTIEKLRTALGKALPGQPLVSVVDSSTDETRLLIRASSDNDPGTYYLFDKTSKQLRRLLAVRPELEGRQLATMKHVTYTATDGTSVPGYLTLPVGGSGKNLPTIVMPHGGPTSRDSWRFDWMVQFFAAQGYAVFQPQFRGSYGFGDDWLQKNGVQSWKTAIGDVIDAGRWMVKQGIADPGKIAIWGWSYGGYAALQSAVVEPGFYKAVVAIAPVTDFGMLKNEYVGSAGYRNAVDFIGSGLHIRDGSPAQNAARIKVPVLMFHGTFDNNVDVKQSRYMDDRLTAAGVPHELVIYEKLDHSLVDSTVRAELLRKSDAFLRKSMGMPAN